MMKYKYLLYICLGVLWMTNCTPKTAENTTTTNKVIDVYKTNKIGVIKGQTRNLTMSKSKLKDLFNKQFGEANSVGDFEIKQFLTSGPNYITAAGKKEGKKLIMAIELEIKGNELHVSEYNTLHTSCLGKYCNDCIFRTDKNGEIDDCLCDESNITSDRKEGYSPCEHRTFIKTLEKQF